MASVTITLPKILTDAPGFNRALQSAIVDGLRPELEDQVTKIITSDKFPSATGLLRRSTSVITPVVEGEKITTGIHFTGEAAARGVTQEGGRRAGALSPPFANILKWVRLEMSSAVRDLAESIQSQYAAAHPKKTKGVSREIGKYEKQAAYLISRRIVRKFKSSGMKGKQFVKARMPTIDKGVFDAVSEEIREFIRHKGLS